MCEAVDACVRIQDCVGHRMDSVEARFIGVIAGYTKLKYLYHLSSHKVHLRGLLNLDGHYIFEGESEKDLFMKI